MEDNEPQLRNTALVPGMELVLVTSGRDGLHNYKVVRVKSLSGEHVKNKRVSVSDGVVSNQYDRFSGYGIGQAPGWIRPFKVGETSDDVARLNKVANDLRAKKRTAAETAEKQRLIEAVAANGATFDEVIVIHVSDAVGYLFSAPVIDRYGKLSQVVFRVGFNEDYRWNNGEAETFVSMSADLVGFHQLEEFGGAFSTTVQRAEDFHGLLVNIIRAIW